MKCGGNRGVNAISHAGTDTGTIRNAVFIFFIFNSLESMGDCDRDIGGMSLRKH